jgi:hypothetical protein
MWTASYMVLAACLAVMAFAGRPDEPLALGIAIGWCLFGACMVSDDPVEDDSTGDKRMTEIGRVIATVVPGHSHYDDRIYQWMNKFQDSIGGGGWEPDRSVVPWFVEHGCSIIPFNIGDDDAFDYGWEIHLPEDVTTDGLLESFDKTVARKSGR